MTARRGGGVRAAGTGEVDAEADARKRRQELVACVRAREFGFATRQALHHVVEGDPPHASHREAVTTLVDRAIHPTG